MSVAIARPFVEFGGLMRVVARRPAGLVGLVGVGGFVVLAFVAPLFVPLTQDVDVSNVYRPPTFPTNPLGTDFQGRDVLNQIVYGGRDILTIAFLAALFSTAIAVTFGSLAATLGGRVDAIIVSVADIVLTVPYLIVLIVVAAIFRPTGFLVIAIVLASLQWAGLLRQVRAQILSLKEREYVEAARSLDLGLFHVIFREMLPNMASYIAIHFIFAMTGAVYAQTGLILLGLIPLSGANWGVMLQLSLQQGAIYFANSFWYIMSPILAIALFQLSLVALATGLEDVFNPRLRAG
ncbi:MAG TPA: ABC transporter permease [Candidatus Limnocylindria bacterium]|nr:ABC transporter permease [Candidatus Limnocylindria bacterium]